MAPFYDPKQPGQHPTIYDLLKSIPNGQGPWDARSPLAYTKELCSLKFPLKIYWSNTDSTVGNQATAQSGKLAAELHGALNVEFFPGDWTHSDEFEYQAPNERLSEALRSFNLIPSQVPASP